MFTRNSNKLSSISSPNHIFSNFYAASFTCILQSVYALFELQSCMTDAGYHNVMTAARKILLKQTSQFWISVRNVCLAIRQIFDAIT